MAKAAKPKAEELTGQTKPDVPPQSDAAAPTGAEGAAPVTPPTTELAAAGTVGQAAAENGQGATSPSAAVNELQTQPTPLPFNADGMVLALVLSRLNHDNEPYAPDDHIILPRDQFEKLKALGVVVEDDATP